MFVGDLNDKYGRAAEQADLHGLIIKTWTLAVNYDMQNKTILYT